MFSPGDDVLVTFDGEECRGEIIEIRNGWVLANIMIDPLSDWGSIGNRLSPVSQVMVRERDVALVDTE